MSRAHPRFPAARFVTDSCNGLEALELLDRGRHIARALGAHLPPSYPDAIDVVLRSLGPEHATDELLGVGMAPFFYLPHTIFVADRGLAHFDLSMRAQYELTKRFSAESSIRAYIAADPERALTFFRTWALDANAHVRRLVSEGTRLRLPWAPRVPWLDKNPERVLALLDVLKDDPSTMVRRSVANNLNDLGKLHPDLLIRTASMWLENGSADRRALVEHALRSAVKRGDPDALGLLGYGKKPSVSLKRVMFTPSRVRIGGRVEMRLVLCSTSPAAQELLVDVAVHFVKARESTGRKVFKLARVTLAPRGRVELKTGVSLKVHTTRTPRPGRHEVDVIVNGKTFRAGSFLVVAGSAPRPGRPQGLHYNSRREASLKAGPTTGSAAGSARRGSPTARRRSSGSRA
jgi:3-methyladenine DNA glycosylase AlkC